VVHHGGGTIAPGTTVLQLAARIANCSTIYFKTGHYRSRRRAHATGPRSHYSAARARPDGTAAGVLCFPTRGRQGSEQLRKG
jgi:hypothetical protein